MVISHSVVINSTVLAKDGIVSADASGLTAEALYTGLKCNYPKFFKMDDLCKWTWLAAEALLRDNDHIGIEKTKTGVILFTGHGCLSADMRFNDSMDIPSPSLFVYTLPNIMLGEICIRHGFKGEQLCMVTEQFDPGELCFSVDQLFQNGNMDACICGWADVSSGHPDICLFWVTKDGNGPGFTPGTARTLYQV